MKGLAMLFEIKHTITGSILFSLETSSMKLTIEAAVKASANLQYADLRGADLRGADLQHANLQYADLRGANLQFFRDDLWAVLSS
ncbi:MAG: hypothetical protein D4R44_06875, partial [Actinobacteria bacterium]